MSTMTLYLPAHLAAPKTRGSWLRKLHEDERGAMMIISIFMAMLVVAMLYYVAGLGETIVFRERLQDASDTAAMAGVVNFARVMNIVALLNIVMASVLAVSVIFAIAAKGIDIGEGEAAAACAASWGSCVPCCQAAACLLFVIGDGCDAHDDAQDIAKKVARATHDAQDGVLGWARTAAIAASAEVTLRHYSGFAQTIGYGQRPPVEVDRSPNRTCDEITSGAAYWEIMALSAVAAAAIAATNSCAVGAPWAAAGAGQAGLFQRSICRREFRDTRARPKRVRNGVNMGGEEFQFRAGGTSTGDNPVTDGKHDARVGVALWDTTSDSIADSKGLGLVSNLSFAQAEYYFAEDESDRLMWTWKMIWRGRLRRFRAGGGLNPLSSSLNALIIH